MDINLIKATDRAKRLHSRLTIEHQRITSAGYVPQQSLDAVRKIKAIALECAAICDEIREINNDK